MATTKETAAAKTATTPPVPLTLQQKFIKLREAVPSITQKAHSDGVKYKFAKIFDVYQLLTPAMNEFGVNFDIVGEQATRHSENGDPIYYSNFTQYTRNGDRIVWCTRPTSRSAGRTQTTRTRLWKLLYTQSERTTEARTRPKAPRGRTASNTTCLRSSALIRATTIQT